MESDSKYERFLAWFRTHGGKYSDIAYPTYFPPTNYIGISARCPIPRHKVIIAIPKQLIIGVQRVKQSELGFILEEYSCFLGQDNDDKDFNILTLFVIFEKMKGSKSFFFPYFECITLAETMVHWKDEQISALDSPFLSLSFLRQVKKQFQPTFDTFKAITRKNSALFPQQLTQVLFYGCYGIVMTRCFGWGLPETMLVPLADFLNHSADGVHHYTFSGTLQRAEHPRYIKKMNHLNLTTLGIDNLAKLPIGFEKDKREDYLEKNGQILKRIGLPLPKNLQQLSQAEFRLRFKSLQAIKVKQSYENEIVPSSESEDNDSESQSEDQEQTGMASEVVQYYRTKRFFKKLFEIIDKGKEQVFQAPKPQINREFEDGVTFEWWYQQEDACFIVATSKPLDEGEQIFNSYGRRSNRFLLLWYGFTYSDNKYDSVPFRLWSEEIQAQTGQLILTKYITDVDWTQQIPLGDSRFSLTSLSSEFRLKRTEIDYRLLAYLRFRIIRSKPKYAPLRTKYGELSRVMSLGLELQVLQFYKKVLGELIKRYRLADERNLKEMQPWRAVFSQILIHSDSEIVYRHCSGVQQMINILEELIKMQNPSVSTLKDRYNAWWSVEEQKSNKLYVQNRIFVRHYFRLLQNYISSR